MQALQDGKILPHIYNECASIGNSGGSVSSDSGNAKKDSGRKALHMSQLEQTFTAHLEKAPCMTILQISKQRLSSCPKPEAKLCQSHRCVYQRIRLSYSSPNLILNVSARPPFITLTLGSYGGCKDLGRYCVL